MVASLSTQLTQGGGLSQSQQPEQTQESSSVSDGIPVPSSGQDKDAATALAVQAVRRMRGGGSHKKGRMKRYCEMLELEIC